jgi:hypothetical protein
LYKECFEAFSDCLNELMEFVIKNKGEEVIYKEGSKDPEKSEPKDLLDDITRD